MKVVTKGSLWTMIYVMNYVVNYDMITNIFINFMKLDWKEPLEIKILLYEVPRETDIVANIHSKVLGGGIPGAVRLRGKGKMNREEWKASARRCVPKLARASQEKCSCFFQTCHMEQPRLKDSNKERKRNLSVSSFSSPYFIPRGFHFILQVYLQLCYLETLDTYCRSQILYPILGQFIITWK